MSTNNTSCRSFVLVALLLLAQLAPVRVVLAAAASSALQEKVTLTDILHSQLRQLPNAEPTACFVNSIGRGVGTPLSSCPDGYELNGLLCYPNCASGYTGVGPVCWQNCPSDLTDIGAFCTNVYGKGCCCTVFGCCGCPTGYTDIGCLCSKSMTKDSYGRGAGIPMTCAPDQEQSGALCYDACPQGYEGIGPVCWGSSATGAFPYKCNDIVWTVDEAACADVNSALGTAGGTSIACIASVIAATVTIIGWPVATVICGASLPAAIDGVNKLMQVTGASTCPSGAALAALPLF